MKLSMRYMIKLSILMVMAGVNFIQMIPNISAQEEQQAIFPSIALSFNYDANRYLVTRDNADIINLKLREDSPEIPEQFSPLLTIHTYDVATSSEAFDIHMVGRSTQILTQESIEVGGQQGILYTVNGWQYQASLGIVMANNRAYAFEVIPTTTDPNIMLDEIVEGRRIWEMVVESVDFNAPQMIDLNSTACENNSTFVADITIPDGTQVQLGQPFTKTWELRNNGTCTWHSDYQLVFTSASNEWDGMSRWTTTASIIPYTQPGDTVQISTTLALGLSQPTAAAQRANYQLQTDTGMLFGIESFVEVVGILEDGFIEPIQIPSPSVSNRTVNVMNITLQIPINWHVETSQPEYTSFSSSSGVNSNGSFIVSPTETKVEIVFRGNDPTYDTWITDLEQGFSANSLVLPNGLRVAQITGPSQRDPNVLTISYIVESEGQIYQFIVYGNTAPMETILNSVQPTLERN